MVGRQRRGVIVSGSLAASVMSIFSLVSVGPTVSLVSAGPLVSASLASVSVGPLVSVVSVGTMVSAGAIGASPLTVGAFGASPPAPTPFPSVAFVVTCRRSHIANDDPIVHPGHLGASHRHDFFGNISTDANSDATSLGEASTTCNESGDRTAYWLPTLRGAGWALHMRAYYSAGFLAPSRMVPYPTGLQLIAGTPSSRGAPGVAVVAFSCGRGVEAPGWSASPPVCPDSTSVRLSFPQCWDGVRLKAPGNAVAPVRGKCPSTYPIALPLLRLVVATAGRVSPTDFVTSAGGVDRLHADFLNAWVPSTLERLVTVCTRGERGSNRDVKQCRTAGTGPRAVGGPDAKETNF